ncbi:MAG: hypothetical protein HY308_05815 [Gammaproteobacteria bacterium]|nr:hypothetical protein [Gammaproteobacteria bacterium]
MTLQLSVPSISTRLLTDVEQRPAKVEKWLATLPLLNVTETGHKLHSTLNTYNRTTLEPALRLKLLELYRAPIKQIGLELQKQYVGLPLPLSERHKSIAEQNREFQVELAHGYKQIVLAHANALTPKTFKEAVELALPVQRAIRHLTEVVLTSHLSYSPVPPGVWREIHQLYRHAEQLHLTIAQIDDPLNGARGKGTIADAYKHALLIDLGDPYHLPSRMIAKIDQYLDSYADLAVLQAAAARPEPNCQFLIDLEDDRAGMIDSADIVLQQPARYRLLNTFDLARSIHAQITQLQSGRTPEVAGLPANYFKDGGQEMLVRLINVWGINPKRAFRRNERGDAKADIAIGVDAINFWLHGGRKLLQSSIDVGPVRERHSVGTFGGQIGAGTANVHEYSNWDVDDESAGGMSLSKVGTIRRRVRVGDVVAIRLVGTETWTIAVVRWLKSPNPSNVEMGTQRLAPTARPVLVKAVAGEKEESDFLAALLLPAIPALKEPETLVIPPNLFRPDRVIFLDDGALLTRIVAKQVLESASGFDRVAFATDSP